MAEPKNVPLETHTHKVAKSKPASNKLKEKICFTLKIHYFFAIIPSSRAKKVDKVFTVK